ncbi:DUF349 domain-containing protein [Fibrobacter sp.]|uniref:DUF349 domain-containing protein n=1 Tax=Fibrobacter sp. TaxID=35828 RepID=UPI0025C4FAA4|nr:DUF349 domain-containing protein [Fibrobacter sp.]MBR3074008.1 DUF349 domain-containing protein [Fibrobacter sp.]
MSIFDAFKPKWQHSNPAKRIEAIADLDELNSQDIVERVALSDDNVEVRMAAIKKLAIIKTLQEISKNDSDSGVRRLAETKAFEEIVKKLKAFNEASLDDEVREYINAVKDTRYAEDVLKATDNLTLKHELVNLCNKQSLLAQIATRDVSEEIALAAADRVVSESLQADLIKNSKHSSVRKKISDKVRAKREAEDNGKKAAELLQSKREALIKQAHFLAAQKDAIATKPQFEDLMKEAQALGMGESADKLNEIYASFNKFYDEANAEKIAAENAAAEKQAKIQHLTETLAELESMLEANTTEENAERVNAIIEEWTANKSIMDAASTKRFNNAYFKTQEAKKIEIPTPESENANEEELTIRKSLLERLQALSDTEIDENTGKHLHAIVREWEKMPLLEGDDPVLQSYNALRTKLNELISAFNEKTQQIVEENSKKLRVLIERIQNIDENQEFREIHKILRDTYQEWKEIVGEQKFKYHDLWQEYKIATSRFQEMQQWENWHNEKDRDTIIEEMDALTKETPSQDVLTKFRELCGKWREIGPISAAKFQDYKDRFQALVDKVKENCAPFIEEQNAERQKNLTEKEGLCQKVEDLVANAEIFWKDKFKAVQEIQENWKNIGMVPKEAFATLNKRFKDAVNAFYAQHKENVKHEDESREANYEKKVALCIEAEAIKDSTDWNATSTKLKQLQEAWKSTGPVPKSKSDEIWTRFRTACDSFFEKKRNHFEEMDAAKQKNLEQKQAICEKLEAFDLDNITPEIIDAYKAIDEEWKNVGMVPKEAVEGINDRYNAIVNKIVAKMAESDPELQAKIAEIKKKKQDSIEKVRQFAESAGSNQLADAVREIQKEWGTLGSCGNDDAELQKAFRDACDDFFTRRRDQLDIQEQARQNNLQKKILLCEQAEDLLTDLNDQTVVASMNKVKHFRRLWKEVGAVPREHSEKIWKRFNTACDQVFAFGRKDEPKNVEAAPAPAAAPAAATEA